MKQIFNVKSGLDANQVITANNIDLTDEYPTIRPSLNLNFAKTKTLDPRITFTRASTATYIDSVGLIKTASNNQPRFDHDPITGECKGLLIEESRTNLLTYSEDLTNSTWVKTRSSVMPNAIISPDGTLSADKLVEDSTASNSHYIREDISAADNTVYTASVFVKAGERTSFVVALYTKDNLLYGRYFDLSTGTITANSANLTGLSTEASITNVGNGWYRCSVTHNISSGVNPPSIRLFPASSTSFVYTGDGVSGLYIWGAQLEAGAFPTSYIPTTTTSLQRSADVASITGTNFSSWYNQNEGTIFATTQITGYSATNPNIIGIYGTPTWDNKIEMFLAATSSPYYRSSINYQATAQMLQNVAGPDNITDKISWTIAYKQNDSNSTGKYSNTTDTSVTLPTTDQLWFGYSTSCTKYILSILYYPKRLSNTMLQNLTK